MGTNGMRFRFLLALAFLCKHFTTTSNLNHHQCGHAAVENRFASHYYQEHGPYIPATSSLSRRALSPSVNDDEEEEVVVPTYAPIRILFDDSHLENVLLFANNKSQEASALFRYIHKDLIPAAVKWVSKSLRVLQAPGRLTLPPHCSRVWTRHGKPMRREVDGAVHCATILPSGLTCGDVKIPDHLVTTTLVCPERHDDCSEIGGAGIANVDYVLFVTAMEDAACGKNTIGFAGHCRRDQSDRPVAGQLNLCPRRLSLMESRMVRTKISSPPSGGDVSSRVQVIQNSSDVLQFGTSWLFDVSFVVHELLHALGFSMFDVGWFRHYQANMRSSELIGLPLVPRDSDGRPPNILNDQEFDTTPEIERLVRRKIESGGRDVRLLATPAIIREATQHFGCGDIDGVPLEDQGTDGTRFGHWEASLFGNEGMTGVRDIRERTVFSAVTLAFMEDSGWYLPDYSHAGEMIWGRRGFTNDPCGFISTDFNCLEKKSDKEQTIVKKDVGHFCNGEEEKGKLRCSADLLSVTVCPLVEYPADLPAWGRYFGNPRLGGTSQIANFCPMWHSFDRVSAKGKSLESSSVCTDASNNESQGDKSIFGESYGERSRCLESTAVQKGYRLTSTDAFRCYEIHCVQEEEYLGSPIIGVELILMNEGRRIVVFCRESEEGTWKPAEGMDGKVKCPSLPKVCFGAPCENGGVWRHRMCVCPPGMIGKLCSIKDIYTNRQIVPSHLLYEPHKEGTLVVGRFYRFLPKHIGPANKYVAISALPNGLKLDEKNGVIQGVPVEETFGAGGCEEFTIAAVNENEDARATLKLRIISEKTLALDLVSANVHRSRQPCGAILLATA